MAKKEVFFIFYSFCFPMHSFKKEMNAGLAILKFMDGIALLCKLA